MCTDSYMNSHTALSSVCVCVRVCVCVCVWLFIIILAGQTVLLAGVNTSLLHKIFLWDKVCVFVCVCVCVCVCVYTKIMVVTIKTLTEKKV